MTRKLKPKNETVMGYLKRRILDPIGLEVAFWRWENGQPLPPRGASLTACEWVKFGLFLKNSGKWNAGAGNQRLYIIASLDIVEVRQSAFGQWDDREFLSKLLLGK